MNRGTLVGLFSAVVWLFADLAAAAPAAAGAAPDQYVSYSGTATARRSTKFLYGERHVLRYRDGRLDQRVVLYTCRNGAPFARKTVAYVDPFAPDFILEDASNGMREGVRSAAGSRSVFFRGNRVEPEKSGPLPATSDLVADTGFDEFIRANWAALMTGKTLELRFLVPGRLAEMGFQAQRVRSARLDGMSVEVIRLKLTGVLGLVLPGIDVTYGAADHALMRYDGLSDLRDAAGNNYQTEITFRASDRGTADEEQNSAARQARLAACT